MAVKVYTPGQFYDAGGVVEEMFYQEVGRTKKYLRKRVGFVRSFKQVIKGSLNFSAILDAFLTAPLSGAII